MKPVMQTDEGKRGNCFSACIASVLEIELSDVPNFFAVAGCEDSDAWWAAVRGWLAQRNLGVLPINADDYALDKFPGCPLIVAGMSPRGVQHATIWMNGRMIHDPHPSGDGLNTIECIDVLYPIDPAKFVLTANAQAQPRRA